MNRRSFLSRIAAGTAAAVAAAAALDPEQLLWTPNTRSFFIPEAPRIANNREVAHVQGLDLWKIDSPADSAIAARLRGEQLIEGVHRYTMTTRSVVEGTMVYYFDTNWTELGRGALLKERP